jgi:anti-sigma B factor antagonist
MSTVFSLQELPYRVSVQDFPDMVVVRLAGQLDLTAAPSVARALTECLGRSSSVLIDASGIDFIDCAGLHALLPAGRIYPEPVLLLPSECVRRLLDLLGLDVTVIEDASLSAGA